MKLAAVFNVWADCACLLPYAVENIRPVVDGVIIVWSEKSNRGEVVPYDLPADCILVQREPQYGTPSHNELAKRNAGLEAVKQLGFTHFIMMDADEFYLQEHFAQQKSIIEQSGVLGTVCPIKTYFKSPTLTVGYDRTLVPFIHKVTPRLKYLLNYHKYPYAYDDSRTPQIDPTRRLNISQGVIMADITMHHMSYIRRNMALKLRNSSANFNGARSEIVYDDLENAKPGYFCKGYQKELIECENIFNLPL